MTKSFSQAAAGIGIATVIWLCGYFFGLFGAHPPTKETDAATWAGALGAFLAFAGAIGISARQIWREDRDRIARARVYAPAIALQLTMIRPLLASAIAALSLQSDQFNNAQKYWGEQLKHLHIWSTEDMEAVLCLPNDCAVSLALVKEIVRVISETLLDDSYSAQVSDIIHQLFRLLNMRSLRPRSCKK